MNGVYATAQVLVQIAAVAGGALSVAGISDYIRRRRALHSSSVHPAVDREPGRRIEGHKRLRSDDRASAR